MVEEIQYLFPDAIIGVDVVFQDDGDGVYISQWNLQAPQPTQAEIDAVTLIIQAKAAYLAKWALVDAYEASLTVTLLNGHKYAANKNARLNIMQERDSLLGIGNNAIEPWLEEWGTFDTNALELQEVLDEALNLLRAYRNSVFGV